jgi:hypothetical protein
VFTTFKFKAFVLLAGLLLPGLMSGQNDKNALQRSSVVGLNFDCSYYNCNYHLKGYFLNDVPTLRNDDDLMWYSELGYDVDVQSFNSPVTGFPIAYASGQALKLSIVFESACQGLPSTIGVRGVSSKGYHFPALQLNVTTDPTGSSFFSYESEASSEKNTFDANLLPAGVVDLIDLDIEWQINIGDWNNENEWKVVAVTNNRIYVTLNPSVVEELDPGAPNNYNPYYYHTHSGFFVGCNAAKGSTNEGEVIQKVWEAFHSADLKNFKNEELKYYNGWDGEEYEGAAIMVKQRNGQCTAWALFFLTVLKNMGVQAGMELVYIFAIEDEHFLVKNWIDIDLFPSNVAAALANHSPEVSILIAMGFQDVVIFEQNAADFTAYLHANNAYPIIYSDIMDESGIIGQNSENPQSIFGFHQVSAVNGTGNIYDPSYGGDPYLDNANFIKAFQDVALFGMLRLVNITNISESALGIDIDGNGTLGNNLINIEVAFVKKYDSAAGGIFLEIFSTTQF